MRWRGQALRAARACLISVGSAVVLLTLWTLIGAAALEWRLARGPLPLPWVARLAEARLNRGEGRATLHVGTASAELGAWRDGPEAPLAVALRMRNPLRWVQADGAGKAAGRVPCSGVRSS